MTGDAPVNFGGITKEYSDYDRAKIVILPIPFENTTTWQKGTRNGPRAIIEASRNMELYDIETKSQVYKEGIATLDPIGATTSEEMVEKAEKEVSKQLENNKFVVTLGGEHPIAIGPIKAYSQKFKDLSVLHLDAHADMRDEWEGSKYNHACAMARAQEFVPNIISVGIRSVGIEEISAVDNDKTFFARDIYDNDAWMDEVIGKLSETIYITIDLDVFDPSILPSTGTPEPGGLGWYQTLRFLEKVFAQKNVVSFDVVELKPFESEKSSGMLASKLIYKLLSYKFLS